MVTGKRWHSAPAWHIRTCSRRRTDPRGMHRNRSCTLRELWDRSKAPAESRTRTLPGDHCAATRPGAASGPGRRPGAASGPGRRPGLGLDRAGFRRTVATRHAWCARSIRGAARYADLHPAAFARTRAHDLNTGCAERRRPCIGFADVALRGGVALVRCGLSTSIPRGRYVHDLRRRAASTRNEHGGEHQPHRMNVWHFSAVVTRRRTRVFSMPCPVVQTLSCSAMSGAASGRPASGRS